MFVYLRAPGRRLWEALWAGESAAASASEPRNAFHWIIGSVISAPSTPSSVTVAPTLALKAVCSSPGCKFPGPRCPPFPPSLLLPPLFLCRPLTTSFILLELSEMKRERTWTRTNTGSVRSILGCHLTPFLHCWSLQPFIVLKWRPLWPLLRTATADIFLL